MAKSPLQIRQIEGKESSLKYDCDSESFVSEKDPNKRLADFMSRLSRQLYLRFQVVSFRQLLLRFQFVVYVALIFLKSLLKHFTFPASKQTQTPNFILAICANKSFGIVHLSSFACKCILKHLRINIVFCASRFVFCSTKGSIQIGKRFQLRLNVIHCEAYSRVMSIVIRRKLPIQCIS